MNAPQVYYGAPPYPPFGHHGSAGPWGYGHYPPSAFPKPFPHPGDLQSSSAPVQARVTPVRAEEGVSQASLQPSSASVQARVMPVHAEEGSKATNQAAPSEFRPKRNYPNKHISEGGMSQSILSRRLTTNTLEVWLFPVDILEDNNKRTFEARSDMVWKDFKDRIVARLDAMEVRLNFRLNVDTRAWSELSCEADFTDAMTRVGDKCLVARTREVFMEVKNVVSHRLSITNEVLTFLLWPQTPKTHAKGKGKRTRADDIPPETPPGMVNEVEHLRDLQSRLLCAAHSKPGMKTYCWIEPAEKGIRGGHREFTHQELTLWAKYIVSRTSERNGQKLTTGSDTWPSDENLPTEHQKI